MDFGAAIFFTDYSIGPAALGRALEERGFGSLWAPEHSHIPLSRSSPFPQGGELPKKYYDVMDPFVTLAAAAVATSRLRVATGICLVVQRDPIQTAKQVATLDQVSSGRFLLGIGAGWNAEEMADHGTDFKTRFTVMRERVEAMKAIWTKSKPEYNGKFVNFPPMMTWPKPVQKPHPPVIVGGAFPYGARRAIAYGDGWVPHARRPAYGDVLSMLPEFRKMAVEAGRDPATLPMVYAGLINAAISDIPDDMTICMHLCRGNFQSTFVASGGYEPVAEILFNEIKVHGYFMEYDTDRAGDFRPLRHVPKGKKVILGLVSTKTPTLEAKDALKRRIDEAARYLPGDHLCLSPQCGFASNFAGNPLSIEDERRKLALVVETAREVWG